MATKAVRTVGRWVKWVITRLPNALLFIVTFPYARFYQYNTSEPLWQMAKLKNEGNDIGIFEAVHQWRTYKTAELEFSFVASGLLTAAFIGAFSWQQIDEVYWITSAFWSCGLVLAFLGVALSAQQRSILSYFGPRRPCPVHKPFEHALNGYTFAPKPAADTKGNPSCGAKERTGTDSGATIHHSVEANAAVMDGQLDASSREIIDRHTDLLLTREHFLAAFGKLAAVMFHKKEADNTERRFWRPKRKMLFFWQAPIMFMGWSVCAFLLGVTLYFVTPLIHGDKGPSRNTAIFYLAVAGFELLLYGICSAWSSALARPPKLAHETH